MSDTWAELRAQDGRARAAAQTVFDRPLAVEAGAGTGKTSTLVARVIAWATGPGWNEAELLEGAERPDRVAHRVLNGIVAITFTDAAAAEMAARVARDLTILVRGGAPEWLLPPEAGGPEPVAPERARALLAALDSLQVKTIHSFCRTLLARHPLAAGLHPLFAVDADGSATEAVVREVVEQAIGEWFGEQPDGAALALVADGVGPPEIAASLALLAARAVPAAALERDPFPGDVVAALFDRLADGVRAFAAADAPRLAQAGPRSPITLQALDAVTATAEALELLVGRDLGALDSLCACLRDIWHEAAWARLEAWAEGGLNKGESRAAGDDHEAIVAACARLAGGVAPLLELRPARLERARRLLAPLLARVETELRARGIEGFDALLRDARGLLAGNLQVAASERRAIRQLLVDEFQDTDRVQCEVLRVLALSGPREERPGLFVVGDPKQSIYGWRSADLEAYEQFIAALGTPVERLSVNHRSVPAVLAEVERCLRPVMRPAAGMQPEFQPLAPSARNEGRAGHEEGERAPVEHWVSWELDGDGERPDRTRAADAAELEATALARDLRALHEGGAAWGDAAVLLRSTSDLDVYLQALREEGVPYAVERDRNYYLRREIIEASALVRAVLDPADHIALVAWLRSSAVGVPDAALLPLWRHRFPQLVTELDARDPVRFAAVREVVLAAAGECPADVPGIERVAGWPRALLAAAWALAGLRESFATDDALVFVERLRASTLIEASEASRYLGAYRAANLDRFFRQLLAALDASGADPHAVLRALRRAVGEAREAEEARPRGEGGDAVRVMTIHRAKGLDFEHVYLLQAHKRAARERAAECDAEEHRGVWEYRLFDAPTPGWPAVAGRRERVAEAEMVRTLYVAMTRAKSRIVVAGNWGAAAGARPASHLDLLRAREPGCPDLEALARRLRLERRSSADEAEARWMFPALRGAQEGRVSARPVAVPTAPDREADEMAQRMASAAARMALPASAPVSARSHDALERAFAERGGDGLEREAAIGAGLLVHQVLEAIDLELPLAPQIEGARRGLTAASRSGTRAEREARRRAADVLGAVVGSPLLGRLSTIAGHVVAREMPVLLPPGDQVVGFLAGAIDLLYRDPISGEIVVADYKTDVIPPDGLAARAEVYRSQLELYGRAVADALGLTARPRLELWFLSAGELVVLHEERGNNQAR